MFDRAPNAYDVRNEGRYREGVERRIEDVLARLDAVERRLAALESS